MPSVIRSNVFGDALVGVVDGVRRAVHGALGTRPYRVSVITRVWSGNRVGVGKPTVTRALELDPPPDVEWTGKYRHGPGGAEEEGTAILTGISLTYEESDLDPGTDARTEVAYFVRDAHGQKARDRWMAIDGPPRARRGDKPSDASDWLVKVKTVPAMSAWDGVPAP